jgi:acetyltransferase
MSADLSMRHYFAPLFEPDAVAIVGASERKGSIGSVLIENMLAAGYRGQLCAVNPKHRAVRGVPCFPTIGEVPRRVDLAVIATPAPTVPGIIEQCGAAGVRAAVVISAGFSESGPAGATLERALLENARRHRLRVLGPNCLGIMRPAIGLNATFARGHARPGSLGLISQSGAVCTAMLDWAAAHEVGFSCVVSLGARQTWTGDSWITSWRPADRAHPALYRRRARRAAFHERAARRGPGETGDPDESRAPSGRLARGGVAYRGAGGRR